MRKPFTYTFGEFIDRLTIISKKDMAGLPGAKEELKQMTDWMDEVGLSSDLVLSIIRIAQCNMDIWHLEHSVRNAADGSIPLSEVGRRSIMIRNTNKKRVNSKNILDKGVFVEEKIKHLSEDDYEKFYQKNGVESDFKTREEGGQDE